jgi:hypothetical protein
LATHFQGGGGQKKKEVPVLHTYDYGYQQIHHPYRPSFHSNSLHLFIFFCLSLQTVSTALSKQLRICTCLDLSPREQHLEILPARLLSEKQQIHITYVPIRRHPRRTLHPAIPYIPYLTPADKAVFLRHPTNTHLAYLLSPTQLPCSYPTLHTNNKLCTAFLLSDGSPAPTVPPAQKGRRWASSNHKSCWIRRCWCWQNHSSAR